MKAFVVERYGRSGNGRIAEMPEPALQDDEVLVQVHAASVNVLDSRIGKGELRPILPYRLPVILGNDLAGIVVRVGAGVQRFKPGDAVYALSGPDRIGSFAERIAVRETSLAAKPDSLGMEEAAAIPLVALTAWQALVETAKLESGQKVLIHAGSGGVGSIAIQLARHLGAHVATTAGTNNLEWVKALGADIVVGYRRQAFESVLHDYDVVLHSLGADALDKSLQVLKPGGRLVSLSGPPTPAFATERRLAWPLKLATRLLSHRIRRKARQQAVDYSFLFVRPDGERLREIAELIDSGAIRPVVDRVFPFDATVDALAHVETGRAKGKTVVKVK